MTTTRWAIAAVLALGLAACHAGGGAPVSPQQQARTVSVVRVQMLPISGGLVTSGVLSPRNQVTISPDLTGYRVAKLYVEEGDWVKAGQPLAQMDGSILQAQLDQQAALAVEQKALADQRDKEAQRVAGLEDQGIIAEEQLQSRRFAALSARGGAGAAAASLKEMQTRLAHLTLRAPVAGQIIQRNVSLGDISGSATTPWFVMSDGGQIELFADVSEGDFDRMRPGLQAKVTLADDSTADGVVRLVSPRIDTTTRLGKVRIALPIRADIRSGGYAKATFTDLSRAVPALPETAVRYDANGASVMVVGADGRVTDAPIKTGEHGGGYVELVTGPPPGAVVVAKAAAQVLPGDYVKPDWPAGTPAP